MSSPLGQRLVQPQFVQNNNDVQRVHQPVSASAPPPQAAAAAAQPHNNASSMASISENSGEHLAQLNSSPSNQVRASAASVLLDSSSGSSHIVAASAATPVMQASASSAPAVHNSLQSITSNLTSQQVNDRIASLSAEGHGPQYHCADVLKESLNASSSISKPKASSSSSSSSKPKSNEPDLFETRAKSRVLYHMDPTTGSFDHNSKIGQKGKANLEEQDDKATRHGCGATYGLVATKQDYAKAHDFITQTQAFKTKGENSEDGVKTYANGSVLKVAVPLEAIYGQDYKSKLVVAYNNKANDKSNGNIGIKNMPDTEFKRNLQLSSKVNLENPASSDHIKDGYMMAIFKPDAQGKPQLTTMYPMTKKEVDSDKLLK